MLKEYFTFIWFSIKKIIPVLFTVRVMIFRVSDWTLTWKIDLEKEGCSCVVVIVELDTMSKWGRYKYSRNEEVIQFEILFT